MKSLEDYFSLPVFQDFLSEDEKKALGDSYDYFIFEESEIVMATDEKKYSFQQKVYVSFYSENRDYLTGDQLDVITLLHNANYKFTGSDVNHLKLDNQDRYIDLVVFSFSRIIRSGC
ncbi:hypothetical protein JZO85_00650 [Enterococcus sp. MJM16]|uniref:Uncharacterized protein n=2 Tax=Candidatus Enterococcus murrayae TaxID=2815321 RepID=A0ABS3HBB5_9ENTE|nr:hypothetical protein [Enterococcus sp. MJM16]MBO0450756.1 hypothetical protein [Enterococcus sp. MJM16]